MTTVPGHGPGVPMGDQPPAQPDVAARTIKMVDAATPQDIPDGMFTAAAPYINGKFAWPQDQIDRFPKIIRISVLPDPGQAAFARVLDVERFDAAPSDAPAFIRERHKLGFDNPTIYCSKDTVPAVRAACHGLKYRFWIASWTGHPHEVDGAWAVQYSGGVSLDYDTSEVYGKKDFSRP
ncbi:MAG: hypothetical protein ACLPUO_13495 [Streptosporangiaceae bacterium]|jgi:hypothetical protein